MSFCVSGGRGYSLWLANNHSKERPHASARCDDREFTDGLRGVVKQMQVDGLEWGEGYRRLGRRALTAIIEGRMNDVAPGDTVGGGSWGGAEDPTAGPPSMAVTHPFLCPVTAWCGARVCPSLCPGPNVGAVVVRGLTADRNGLTDFRILRASRWVEGLL